MALTRLGGANAITGTLPAANINDTSIGNITSLPTGVGGKVLQVVQQSSTAKYETNSTSYSDVISKAITPVSSSSTIYVHFNTRVYMPTLGMEHNVKILRDSTTLDTYRGAWHTGSGTTARRESWEYYDTSHGTTSSITYKIQQAAGSSNFVSMNPNGATDGIYYLTLMEIA